MESLAGINQSISVLSPLNSRLKYLRNQNRPTDLRINTTSEKLGEPSTDVNTAILRTSDSL